jgi:hypothetical protein
MHNAACTVYTEFLILAQALIRAPRRRPKLPGFVNRRLGYGSTDLQLYTSTKLKIVKYWLYSLMHKNKIYI